jgi:hypothetical protein
MKIVCQTWLEIRKADYRHALKLYQYLKDYVTGEGVQLFPN